MRDAKMTVLGGLISAAIEGGISVGPEFGISERETAVDAEFRNSKI
jgi:hypothetical protein